MNAGLAVREVETDRVKAGYFNGGDDSLVQNNRDVYKGLNGVKYTLGNFVPASTSNSAVSNSIHPFNFTTLVRQENNVIDSFAC